MSTSSSSQPHPLVDGPPAEEEIAGLDLRRLDPDRIVTTLKRLERRIDERFPSSGLAAVAGELLVIARECRGRLWRIARPNWTIRVFAALGVALVLAGLVAAFAGLRLGAAPSGLFELVQGLEAAINDVVFLATGLFFLFTLEGRLKRRKVLVALTSYAAWRTSSTCISSPRTRSTC